MIPSHESCSDSDPESHLEEVAQCEEGEGSIILSTSDTLCKRKCCDVEAAVVSGQPYQIESPDILAKTKKLQGTKSRQFSVEWFKKYPWLVLCSLHFKAFCYMCKYCYNKGYLLDKYYDKAFVTSGFSNWKKAHERFQQHSKCNSHRESIMTIQHMKYAPGIDAQLNKQFSEYQQTNYRMLLKQLSSLRYLLRQGIAMRGHEQIEGNLFQLLLLRSEEFHELKQWDKEKHYLSNQILDEMISLMGRSVTQQLLKDIHSASIYSLIGDEATDISNTEQLCISLRWVAKMFTIPEDALELTHLTKTDAETITSAIKDFLLRYQLQISLCRGQAYDGASNMSGKISGVAARIQHEEPTAIYVHCLAHSLNLCLQTLTKSILPIKEALDLAMDLGMFINRSPKRSHLFKTLQAQLSPDSPSIKTLCPTRWTVRTRALESLIKNYKVLTVAMIEIQNSGKDEYAMKAAGFLQSLDKFSTFYGLNLSYLIFSATEQLSVNLQSQDITIQDAVSSANLATSYLDRQRSEDAFERFYGRVLEESKDLTSEPLLPRYRRMPKRLDVGSEAHRYEDAKSLHKQQYFEAMETVKGEIDKRFHQERGMQIAAVLEKMLLGAFDGKFDLPDEISKYSKDLNVEKLKIQLQMLPDLLNTFNLSNPSQVIKSVTKLRTLCDIMNSIESSKTMLGEVCQLLHIILTIPVSSSTAEHTFSAMRRLKTFLRSSMSQTLLNDVMLLHIHKDKVDRIELTDIARQFIQTNERRKKFFGTV